MPTKHITYIVAFGIAVTIAGCATQKNLQASSAGSGVYIVQQGDTIARIARMHHLSIEQLENMNPDMAPRLKIGEKLYVSAQAGK